MTLPTAVSLEDTFDDWIADFNSLIDHVGDANNYVLVTQNATPVVSTGNVAIDGTVTATRLVSVSGTTEAANNTWTALTTLPNVLSVYQVAYSANTTDAPASYTGTGVLRVSGGSAVWTSTITPSLLTLQVSGLELQGRHTGGGTKTLVWSLLRVL